MTTDPIGTLDAAPATDVVGALRTCQARLLEREGIAMFVALHDGRTDHHLDVRDERAAAEGRRLAELFDHYHSRLEAADFPSDEPDEPDETGAADLISSLVVLSDQHLRARPGES